MIGVLHARKLGSNVNVVVEKSLLNTGSSQTDAELSSQRGLLAGVGSSLCG